MVGREVGKNVLASEVGRACVKALSQKGKGEFEAGKMPAWALWVRLRISDMISKMRIHRITPAEWLSQVSR